MKVKTSVFLWRDTLLSIAIVFFVFNNATYCYFLMQLHGYSVQFYSSIILFSATCLSHTTITMGLCKRDHIKLENNKTASWLCVNGLLKVCLPKTYFFLMVEIADPCETENTPFSIILEQGVLHSYFTWQAFHIQPPSHLPISWMLGWISYLKMKLALHKIMGLKFQLCVH